MLYTCEFSLFFYSILVTLKIKRTYLLSTMDYHLPLGGKVLNSLVLSSGIPCFLKVHFISLHFYERSISVPDFANKRNQKRSFALKKKKKAKSENNVQHLFCSSCYRGSVHPEQLEWYLLVPSPGKSASQHQALIALNCVFKHLYFIFIYFVHLLAKCGLGYQNSLRELGCYT